MSKEFKQKLTLPGTPKQVFEALTTSRFHSKFTGAPAFVSKTPGGKFSAYNGHCLGRNIELKSNKFIVQAWRAKNWRKDVFSIVTFRLKNTENKKCILEFSHAGIPDDELAKIKDGWTEHYWKPLKKYLREQNATVTNIRRKAA